MNHFAIIAQVFLVCALQCTASKVTVVTNVTSVGPFNYGSSSLGYVTFNSGTKLTQQCTTGADPVCAKIIGGIMSTIEVSDDAKLIQYPASSISCGNYSYITLASSCVLTMHPHSGMMPNLSRGGGRIEVFCSQSNWLLGNNTYINLDRQAKLIVQADFSISNLGLVRMDQASTLEIKHTFVMEELVWLNLGYHSYFSVNVGSKAVPSISSSAKGYTSVNLEPSSSVLISGDFIVGKGINTVTMTLGASGALIVNSTGDFEVASAEFTIGPSSFWQINGIFNLDEASTFSSGIQSNLTLSVGAEFHTEAGVLSIGAFSSIQIKGYCKNQAGVMETAEFSHLVIGPTDEAQTFGSLTLNGGKLILLPSATAIVIGSFSSEEGVTNLRQSTLLSVGSTNAVYSNSGNTTLNQFASLQVDGTLSIKQGANVYIGKHGAMVIAPGASLLIYGGTLSIGDSSLITFPTSLNCLVFGDYTVPDFTNLTVQKTNSGIACR